MSALRKLRRQVQRSQGTTPVVSPQVVEQLDTSRVGRINAYDCEDCHGYTVTRDVDAGVTPMFLACRATEGCTGRAVSLCYPSGPVPDWLPEVEWEWYRPFANDPEVKDHPGMKQHVAQGGLALRKIT